MAEVELEPDGERILSAVFAIFGQQASDARRIISQ